MMEKTFTYTRSLKNIEVSFECEYIDKTTHEYLLNQCDSVARMINSMIEKSALFFKAELQRLKLLITAYLLPYTKY